MTSTDWKQIHKILKYYSPADLLILPDPVAIKLASVLEELRGTTKTAAEKALESSVYYGDIDVVRELLKWGTNPNITVEYDKMHDYHSGSILIRSIELEHPEMFYLLLEHGARPEIDNNGTIKLLAKMYYGHLKRGLRGTADKLSSEYLWIPEAVSMLIDRDEVVSLLDNHETKTYDSIVEAHQGG